MQLICGMHRSGTSLIARIAYLADADLGDPRGFQAPDIWNPQGYFEQREIIALNSKLIHGLWGRGAYLFLPSSNTILRRAAKASSEILKLGRRYEDKIVKDNRFCLTLDAWRRTGIMCKRILVVFRDPLQVAKSLKKRNKIPFRLAFYLWHEHMVRLRSAISDLPVQYIWYDRLISDEIQMTDELTKVSWLVGADEGKICAVASKAIRFSEHKASVNISLYPKKVANLYINLIELSKRNS